MKQSLYIFYPRGTLQDKIKRMSLPNGFYQAWLIVTFVTNLEETQIDPYGSHLVYDHSYILHRLLTFVNSYFRFLFFFLLFKYLCSIISFTLSCGVYSVISLSSILSSTSFAELVFAFNSPQFGQIAISFCLPLSFILFIL